MYNCDLQKVNDFYSDNYSKYGYSVKSLAWVKGKQNIRFEQLTQHFDLSKHFKILDIGCGFGDLNLFFKKKGISDYEYVGIDLVEGFIEKARTIYAGDSRKRFVVGSFADIEFAEKFDIIIESGIFNFKMDTIGNYENIKIVLDKSYSLLEDNGGISFDFQSDKVDYQADNGVAFYNSPEKVLSMFFEYSRNLIFNNTYMPFEFAITLFKDDSFDKKKIVFEKFKNDNKEEFESGLYYEE